MMVTLAPLASSLGNPSYLRRPFKLALGVLAILLMPSFAAALITPTTTLTVSSGTVTSGTAVTLTAYVHASGGGPYGGQVAFCDASAAHCTDIHQIGVGALIAGYANVKFIPGPGAHSYKAVYLGNASYASSTSASVAVSVTPLRATSTSITLGGSQGSYSLAGAVSGSGSTPPTGTVSFLDTSNSNYVLGTGVLGGGSSAFSLVPGSACSIGQAPGDVAVGDFNGDGIPDLAVVSPSVNGITICLAHLDGTFSTLTQTLPTNPSSPSLPVYLITGDFNNDGIADLVIYQSSTATNNNQTLTLLTGNGDGTFTGSTNLSGFSHGTVFRPVTGDFDGDGNPDLAYIQEGLSGYTLMVYRGKGDGTFYASSSVFTSLNGEYPVQLAAADVNNDGRTDLIALGDFSAAALHIELGNSDGSFTTKTQTQTALPGPSFVLADFNQDGNLDLSLIQGNSLVILNGNGDGTFTQGTTLTPATSPSFLRVGDFNGDGHADLAAILSGSSNNVSVYLGAGDGTFATPPATATAASAAVLARADFTGSGFSDLAVLPSSGTAIADLLGSPTASATVTVTNVSPVGAGNHLIVARYPGDANFAPSTSSSSLLMAEPVGDTLTLTVNPASSVSGQQVTLTATLSPYTAQNHTTDGETVTFATYPGAHILGTGTLANGVATLTLSTLLTGMTTLSAHYGGDGNFYATTDPTVSYTVAASTSTTLYTGHSSAPAGFPITLTASVLSGSTPITSGLVAFCDASAPHCTDIHRLGTAQLTSAGTATLQVTPRIGANSYKAIFLGTTAAASSSSAASSVPGTGRFLTSTTLTSSGAPGSYTLAATVSSVTHAPLSGNVSFTDTSNGNASLGSAPLGTSASSFSLSAPEVFSTAAYPRAIATGDFNNDGNPDFVTAAYAGNALFVELGNGDGTFTFAGTPSSTTLSNPDAIAVGDFNGDGKLDLAVANYGSGNLSIFLGNGDGTFVALPAVFAAASPQAIVAGDFNKDGIPDLAVASAGSGTGANSVSIFFGQGNGSFNAGPVLPAGNYPAAIVTSDFNNDGNQDIAAANAVDGTISVFFGDGTGQFPTSRTLTNTGGSYGLATADLNGDGNADLVALNSGGNAVTVLLGDGTGAFTQSGFTTGLNPIAVVIGDLNGDGVPDIVTANNNSGPTSLDVSLGNGDGTFRPAAPYATGTGVLEGLALADFNNDGFADPVATIVNTANTAMLFLAQPTQTATATVNNINPTGAAGSHLAQATYPGDPTHASSTSNLVSLSALPYAAAPTFSPAAGTYTSAQSVTLSTTTPGATIFYTTNGSTPSASSAQYTTPLSVSASETIEAIASAPNYQTSPVSTVAYTITYPPTITTQPSSQTITSGNSATLTVAATGTATITYQWFSGTSPSTASPIPGATGASYTTPVLSATSPPVATYTYWVQVNNASAVPANSNTATVTVNALPVAAAPTFSPLAGTYTSAQSVTLATSTPTPYHGIYYTIDGSTPTTASPQYTAPISVTASETIRAFTAASGYQNSPVATAAYTIVYPPTITTQPASQTITSGSPATLTVSATGTAPLTYQWYSGSSPNTASPIAGATAAAYTTPALTSSSSYWVQVSNASGVPANSATATITVLTPPAITTQPASQTITSGSTATLSVSASGTAPLAYQWYTATGTSAFVPIAGATSATYITPALTATALYQVQVSNASGVPATSATASITVITPPAITIQPASQTINSGSTATLSVSASGTAPLAYQWYAATGTSAFVPITGATFATYTTPALTSTTSYQVQVSNASGVPATSATATITVVTPPAITTQPASQTINAGSVTTLAVSASGTAPLTYQWYSGTGTSPLAAITGATASSYTTPALTTTTYYQVQVTNASGVVATSATASITVITPPAITAQTPNPTINAGQTATLGVTATGTSPSYQWFNGASPSTASPIPGATSPTYTTPILADNVNFWVQVSNAAATRNSATFVVTVIKAPTCSLSVQAGTTALAVVATASCTDPQGQSLAETVTWGDLTSSLITGGSATLSHPYAAAGTYTVTLSATNTSGLTGTATQRVSPNQSPTCTLGPIQGQTPAAAMYPVSVTGSCSDPQNQSLTLSLDWGDNTPPTTAPPFTHVYDTTNSPPPVKYNVVLTATDSSMLSGSSAVQSFQIVPTPTPVSAGGSSQVTPTTIAPPAIPPSPTTQVIFSCASVSGAISGQNVNNALPSTYGISCTSQPVLLTLARTPVNVTITTTGALVAANRDSAPGTTLLLCGLASPLFGLALLPLLPGRRRRQFTSVSLAFFFCLSLCSCGGFFRAPPATPTPPATYYITVVESIYSGPIPTGFVQTSLIVPLKVTTP